MAGNFKNKKSGGKKRTPFVADDRPSTSRNDKKEDIRKGRIIEALPNTLFKIQYIDGTIGMTYLGGKMKLHRIRILVGDMVEVVYEPLSKKGRIVKRQ
jgi:translation initiation factor IF-1